MSYADEIELQAGAAIKVLRAKGIDKLYLSFGPEPQAVPDRIWAPAQSQTKFQMEQALGDWAEGIVQGAINDAAVRLTAIPFGDNDKTLSQDEMFAERYRAGKIRELTFGK